MPVNLRPKFEALRLVSANIDCSSARASRTAWHFEITKSVEVGVAYPKVEAMPIVAILKVKLNAAGSQTDDPEAKANLAAEYESVFKFDLSVSEPEVVAGMEADDELQFLLSAQAVTLASSSFRSFVQQCGFDAKMVPLAI